jgi:secreted trypsin-like serine protease
MTKHDASTAVRVHPTKIAAMKLSLVAATAIVMASGCAAETNASDETDSTDSAIVGGQATTAYPAVGALTRSGSPFCTGTVIAKRTVVTAAHCLDGASAVGMRFALGPSGNTPQAQLGVARIIVHPSYDAQNIKNDIGLVILAQDAPVTPVAVNGEMPSSWVGRSLTFVGYGVTNGVTQQGAGTKRVVSIAISEVGGTQFAYADSAKNTCFGDSGGPAFATDAAGRLVIAGVTSYGDQRCAQYGVDTRVDAFRSFIASVQQ